MQTGPKKRIEFTVERAHVAVIASCLDGVDHEDFSVRPVMPSWTTYGLRPGHHGLTGLTGPTGFGSRVAVAVTIEAEPMASLLAGGFAIIGGAIVPVNIRDLPPAD